MWLHAILKVFNFSEFLGCDREALQIKIPWEVRHLSPTNMSTKIQSIIKEDLKLRVGEFVIWRRLDDEINNDNHLLIHQTIEGNWVTLQVYPSNRSIHLLYPINEGAPLLPKTTLENTEKSNLQTNNCSWTSTGEVDPDRALVEERMRNKTTDEDESSVNNNSA